MMRSWMLPVVVLGFSACMVGPSTRRFAPANGPKGIEADLVLKSGRIQGEVLEVQDTALLLLRVDRVVLVPLRAIRAGRFRGLGQVVEGGGASHGQLARLRLLSRFPAGLTPEIRTRLLRAYGQTEPDGAP